MTNTFKKYIIAAGTESKFASDSKRQVIMHLLRLESLANIADLEVHTVESDCEQSLQGVVTMVETILWFITTSKEPLASEVYQLIPAGTSMRYHDAHDFLRTAIEEAWPE